MGRSVSAKQYIHDLPAKLNALCIAATKTKNLKDLIKKGEGEGITSRTLENWQSGKISPHTSKLSKFSENLGIDFLWWGLDLGEFCERLAFRFGANAEDLYSNSTQHLSVIENSVLGLVGGTYGGEWLEQEYSQVFSGSWFAYHYWEQHKESRNKTNKEERYVFKHLINFYKFNKKLNSILFNFASARQKSVSWNYVGNLIISQSKLYFITQTTIKAEVEVLLIVANRPVQQKNIIKGILLASTPSRECDGIISRPASARILLKKIDDDPQKDAKEYFGGVGIIPESKMGDEGIDIDLIRNSINTDVGILFPRYTSIDE